jgi:hypothetical protein
MTTEAQVNECSSDSAGKERVKRVRTGCVTCRLVFIHCQDEFSMSDVPLSPGSEKSSVTSPSPPATDVGLPASFAKVTENRLLQKYGFVVTNTALSQVFSKPGKSRMLSVPALQ